MSSFGAADDRSAPEPAPCRTDDLARLLTLIAETVDAETAREVLWLSLSMLPRSLAQPHHLRLARDALASLETADRMRKFSLPNADQIIVWRGAADDLVTQCEILVRHLFADEPALLPEPDRLLQRFRLPVDAARMREKIAVSVHPSERGGPRR